jgi:hypothetical protein
VKRKIDENGDGDGNEVRGMAWRGEMDGVKKGKWRNESGEREMAVKKGK